SNMADERAVHEVNDAVDVAPAFELESDLPEVKLFGKWNLQEVNVADISLVDYIAVKEKLCPSWTRRYRPQAFDVAPLRRVNQAMWLLYTGAHEAAFRNIKTVAECLADELINAAKESNSYAIKKDELERVAKFNG
ncbi:hypothetical protein PRIPAC_84043, partial [Pristionchus pacificus]|uniref:Ribosomal protein n=1 Tax=Pristionchus pacificus TaxID=54126 RepID=A0A2A6BRS5_PRIPA